MDAKGVIGDSLAASEVYKGSCDSKFDAEASCRRVGFDQSVRVILIPSRDEYRKVGLYGALWWSGFEFSQFQASAHNEIRALALEEGIGARAARRKLYQPSLEGREKWGEMKRPDSQDSMIAKNMLKLEEVHRSNNKNVRQSDSNRDSLKEDANTSNLGDLGLGIGTQSPTDSLKVTNAKTMKNTNFNVTLPEKAGHGVENMGKTSAASSPSPPRYTKRTFDIANYNSEEILKMSPVAQNRKLLHSPDGVSATIGGESTLKKVSALGSAAEGATSAAVVFEGDDGDDGSVHTDSDTDMEEETAAARRGQGEQNLVVSPGEEGDAPPPRMHRTSSLQEISRAVQRSDSVSNLKMKASRTSTEKKNPSPLVLDTTSDAATGVQVQEQGQGQGQGQPRDPGSALASLDEPKGLETDATRSLHGVITSRAPFSPSLPTSRGSKSVGGQGQAAEGGSAATADEEQTGSESDCCGIGSRDCMDVDCGEEEKREPVHEQQGPSQISRNYEPDSWEALGLSVPLLKPAVLDDMSAKRRRFSSHELWSKQKGIVGATMDFLGIGAMGPWRMLGWVVVACSMYIITTDASQEGGTGPYDSAGDLGAQVLGNENISF